SAWPSAMAAVLLRTKRARLEGSGTGTVLSDGGAGGNTWAWRGRPSSVAPSTTVSSEAHVFFMGPSRRDLLTRLHGKRQVKNLACYPASILRSPHGRAHSTVPVGRRIL